MKSQLLQIISFLASEFLFALSTGLGNWKIEDLESALSMMLFVGLPVGLLVALWFGGLDVIQHYTLHLNLYFRGHIPYNYAHFLDYAAELVFLQKVGGNYTFIHRIFMEHFAKIEIK